MELRRAGTQPSGNAPAENFSGAARIDPLFQAPWPARMKCFGITFEPGARSAWHANPLGQTLLITGGLGLAQGPEGFAHLVRPGDVVWFPPSELHWQGATPGTSMTCIAIQEDLEGMPIEWLDKVSDVAYMAAAEQAGMA